MLMYTNDNSSWTPPAYGYHVENGMARVCDGDQVSYTSRYCPQFYLEAKRDMGSPPGPRAF